jgi:hypothetical protein
MLSSVTTVYEFWGVSQNFMGHQNTKLSLGKRPVIFEKEYNILCVSTLKDYFLAGQTASL